MPTGKSAQKKQSTGKTDYSKEHLEKLFGEDPELRKFYEDTMKEKYVDPVADKKEF